MCECAILCSSSLSAVSTCLEAIAEMIIFKGKRFRGCSNELFSFLIVGNLNGAAVSAFTV
jgi:hypothetical protein